ncbi:MAG: hypothetical protein R3B13_26415 [Polyangiaceae bacterium]
MNFSHRSLALGTTLACLLASQAASAGEGWLIDGEAGLGTGLEGADPGSGNIEWQRARTRILAGVQLRTDENESEGTALRAFAELEKRGSVGGEARYSRFIHPTLGAYIGVIGTVAPETLFGGTVGAHFIIPFGDRVGIFIEPSFSAMPVGSDLPGDGVLMWGLLSAGVRLGL